MNVLIQKKKSRILHLYIISQKEVIKFTLGSQYGKRGLVRGDC